MTNVHFRIKKPAITTKEFVKSASGNYVLKYEVANASINSNLGANTANRQNLNKFTTIKDVLSRQTSLRRTSSMPLTNKTKVMNVLNTKPCG